VICTGEGKPTGFVRVSATGTGPGPEILTHEKPVPVATGAGFLPPDTFELRFNYLTFWPCHCWVQPRVLVRWPAHYMWGRRKEKELTGASKFLNPPPATNKVFTGLQSLDCAQCARGRWVIQYCHVTQSAPVPLCAFPFNCIHYPIQPPTSINGTRDTSKGGEVR
jgi:hypothetical protein